MIGIEFKFPDWAAKLTAAENEINLFIAAQMQFNRGQIFDKEGAYNGRARWKDLVFREGQILSKRGTLRKSIGPFNPKGIPGPDGIVRFQGDSITIGTKVAYARMMNDGTAKLPGGVLRGKNSPRKVLKIPIPQGYNANDNARNLQRAAMSKKIDELEDKRSRARTPKSKEKYYQQILRAKRKMGLGEGPVKFIFRKSVRIPARPFDDWTQEDATELNEALKAKITQVLNRRR